MALPASDSFTGTDGTSLPTYSSNWTIDTGNGGFIIQTNAARPNAIFQVSLVRWNADTFSNNQYAQGTITNANSDPGGVLVRAATDGTSNYYGAMSDSDSSTEWFKYVAGSYTLLSSLPFMANGDVIRLEVYGSTLAVYKNGIQHGPTLTDSSHTSGAAGLTGYSTGSTSIDNWSAGNLTAPLAPAFVAAGTGVESITTISPAWPSHVTDDIGLLFVESTGGQPATLSTAAGFVAVTNSPQATGATTSGTQISVFWCRATSGAMSAPTVADPGDHVYGVILTFRGCPTTGNPWNITAGSVTATAGTTTTFPTVTTTVANCLIVLAAARDTDSALAAWSAPVNAALGDLQERFDLGTALGNGGGLGIYTGVKSVAGATGTTTATVSSSINAQMTIALAPIVPAAAASDAPFRAPFIHMLVR
jgi:hypothetical protein